jgi:small-conductance mechanosensitive channel
MQKYLEQEFWGNQVNDYLIAIAILIGSVFVIQIIKKLVFTRLKGSEQEEGILSYKFLIKSVSSFAVPLLYLGGLYLAMQYIETNLTVSNVLKTIYLLIAVWILIKFARAVIEFIITKYSQSTGKEDDVRRFRPLLAFINFTFYIIGILFILDNLGFEISTVIAGLGIGGIAIALAAQAILGDLFSYFVIYFDKPFELGDFVIFDDKLGVIEKIGIKSTRIRTLRGELLVTSNSNLTNARLHNFKQMQRRRAQFNIGVTYQTKAAQLEEIPKIIKRIIDETENATYDRSHFFSYGDFSLNFETIFYVESNDYIKYMDVQQKINLEIYKEFEARGIQFAYPTRTIYMNQQKEN